MGGDDNFGGASNASLLTEIAGENNGTSSHVQLNSQAATWSSNDGTGGLLCNISGLVHCWKATLAHPRRINDSLLLLMPDLVPDQLVWSVYLSSVCCTHTELTTD